MVQSVINNTTMLRDNSLLVELIIPPTVCTSSRSVDAAIDARGDELYVDDVQAFYDDAYGQASPRKGNEISEGYVMLHPLYNSYGLFISLHQKCMLPVKYNKWKQLLMPADNFVAHLQQWTD
jgi:hypothetical protein